MRYLIRLRSPICLQLRRLYRKRALCSSCACLVIPSRGTWFCLPSSSEVLEPQLRFRRTRQFLDGAPAADSTICFRRVQQLPSLSARRPFRFRRLQSQGFVLNLGSFLRAFFLFFLSCDGSTTKRCSSWYGFPSWASERIAPHRRHGSLLLYRKVRHTQSNHQGEPPAAPAPHPLRPTRPASSASPASPTSLEPMTAPSATFRASGKLATRCWPATHAA